MIAQPDEASPPWCLRLISELDAADAIAKTLAPRQLNWKPGPGEWSVGQCFEYLCVANEVYLEAISDWLVARQHAVVQDITPGWFGRWFIRRDIEPSPFTIRLRAMKRITPGAKADASVLDRFLSSNRNAREVVRGARNYDVNRIRFRNPFILVLRFTVGTGLEILSKPERRPLLQAQRIRESASRSPDFQGS